MPFLSYEDPLPARPQRVLVAGTSGSGKTTLAGRIGDALQVPHTEIDALFHGPGWTPRPEFEADVRRLAATPAWVVEWQYAQVRPLLGQRADLVVWLDLSRGLVLRQVALRTLRRRLNRRPLWNGNLEPPLWTLLTDPQHVVRWAWTTHPGGTLRITALAGQRPDLPVVRLGSRAAVGRWLAGPLQRAAAAAAQPHPVSRP